MAAREHVRAARLLGAEEALRTRVGAGFHPVFRREQEQSVETLRAALGDAELARYWREGASLPEAAAIALALGSEAPRREAPARLAPRPAAALSVREREMLRFLAAGSTNREIAATLVLSVRTVEGHLRRLYDKIGARRRADAVAYAVREAEAARLQPDTPAAAAGNRSRFRVVSR